MAYWLFCQSCQQWSKSATPLSADKVCPFCSTLLMKVKGNVNTMVATGSAEKSEDNAPQLVIVEAPEEKAASPEAVPPEDTEGKGVSEPVGVGEVVDQPAVEEPEPKAEDMEEAESDAGHQDVQDAPAEDSRQEVAESEDQDDLAAEEEAGEEAKTPEADSVKISEVRVITDQNEKKDRLGKKVRR